MMQVTFPRPGSRRLAYEKDGMTLANVRTSDPRDFIRRKTDEVVIEWFKDISTKKRLKVDSYR